jgi:RHS repeat-associated protein
LTRVINPDAASSFTGFGYDSLGRRNSIKDPMGNITAFQYDELSRVSTVTQPGDITTILGYTVNNRLQTEADANRNTTTYLYDDMGRVYQVSSPDTGTTVYRYDPAGNMVSKKDAKGTTLTYQYDALNRLTKIYFPTDAGTAYTYDSCVNGKGRLCSMSDVAGTTNYEYTPKGQIQKETKILDGYTYITKYAYDPDGNISTIIYPSGKTITYTYLNGRVVAVLKDNTTLASNITYKPFGGMTSITYANGLTGTIGYDNQYRITSIITGAVLNLSYTGFDYNGNVTTIKNNLDTTKNRSFGYDALNRLTSANGFWGGIGWLYDGVGNRTIQTDSGGTSSYSYLAGTNKISGIMGANSSTFTFDADGNTYSENTRVYTYNENQRLIKVTDGGITTGQYMYNANGQRVKKVASGVATYFLYGPGGRLIAESNSAGTITTEYIYLNGQLFGKMEGTNIYYYHNDHLGTPQKMTDSFGTVVWAADYKPFGETTVIVSTITNNLRFPGQYYDTETGLNYNYRRDYNSILGLYIEADPLWLPFFYQGKNYFLVPYYTKLPSRLHEYVYAENSPVMNSDPRGLMGAKGGSAKDKDAGNSTGNQCMTKLQQRINNGSCPNWTDCFTCCNDLMPDIFGTEAIVVCTEACDAGLKIAKKKSCKCSDSSL